MSTPAAPRRSTVFVDAIEGRTARLVWGERTVEVPLSSLPDGTKEGEWIEITIVPAPRPREADATERARRQLAADDDGGDIKL
jgi:hypothetical protein